MSAIVHQITSGLAGWLTYEQMRDGVDNLREGSLAKPLEDLAAARGFAVKTEFSLPRTEGQRGGPTRIDFLLVNAETMEVVALETKFKKAGAVMPGGLGIDAARLHAVTIEAIDSQIAAGHGGRIINPVAGYRLTRAVLVAWHQSSIMEQMRREPLIIQKQFLSMVEALLPEGMEPTSRHFSEAMLGAIATRPVGLSAGSLRAGSTVTRRRFWVAALLHRANWARL